MNMKRLLDEARRLTRINSVTGNGNEEAVNFLAGLAQDRGFKVQLQHVTHSLENVSKRQFNVLATMGDPLVDRKIKKGLLLSAHLDTTAPGQATAWTATGGDPFALVVRDGNAYGLGVSYAKMDFLCKLHAASLFREKKLKMPIYLAGTAGAELGMFGARYLIKSLAFNPRYALVGAPTGLKIATQNHGQAIFRVSIGYQLVERDARGFNRQIELKVTGQSAHSADPQRGAHAIEALLDFVSTAVEQGFEMRFVRMEGGGSGNQIPDQALATLFSTAHQFEDFKRFFREYTRSLPSGISFSAEFPGAGEAGMRFLPDTVFPCLLEVVGTFKELGRRLRSCQFVYLSPQSTGVDLYFDFSLLPGEGVEALEAAVREALGSVAIRYLTLNLNVIRDRFIPGLVGASDELVKQCEAALTAADVPPQRSEASVAGEAALYAAAGYDALTFGPGEWRGNSHAANEQVPLEQLERAVGFYIQIIERICL
jgi:acetylornithine deacetylase/succinyl-diaminopimelate desuccinylase-like protein